VCQFQLPQDGGFDHQKGDPTDRLILILMLVVLLTGEPFDKWILVVVIVACAAMRRAR
jgi:hypothetical protein